MNSITKPLILKLREIANFIALEGGNKECYLVRPYTNDICAHWRFVNETIARKSANKIYSMFCDYKEQQDFIGMDVQELCWGYGKPDYTRPAAKLH